MAVTGPFTPEQVAQLERFKASDLRQRSKNNPYERLYRIARKAAVDTAGGERAFRVIGSTLAAALVRSEVLSVIYNQDEDTVSPARMVEFARYAAERVTDELNAETI